MIAKFFIVFIGGGIGAALRFATTVLFRNLCSLPILGTLCVNLIGCFFIGYACGWFCSREDIFSQTLKLFLTVGILGGLTTFSTFNFEVFELVKNGKYVVGILYFTVSCLIGLILTYVGYVASIK